MIRHVTDPSSRLAQVVVTALAAAVASRDWITGSAVFAKRGTLFTMLAVDHLQRALSGAVDWKAAPLAWPLDPGITQLDWVGGLAVLSWPLGAAGVDPLIQHSILTFFAFLSCGIACAEVARALLGPGPHTWAAGILAAINPAAMYDACYGNLLHHETIVAGGLLLAIGLDRRRPAVAGLGAAGMAASGHFGLYVGVHGALALGVTCAAAAIGRRGDVRSWAAAAVAAMAAWISLVPVLSLYATAKSKYGMEVSVRDSDLRSVAIDSVLRPMHGQPVHEALGAAAGVIRDVAPLNPGYLAAILLVLGLVATRGRGPRWAWGAVFGIAALSAVLSLGPQLEVHAGPTGIPGLLGLFSWIPGADALRSPFRWLLLTWLGTAVIAAAGAKLLVEKGRIGQVIYGVLLVGSVLEARRSEGLVPLAQLGIDPVYARIAGMTDPGALYDVRATQGGDGTDRMRAAFVHNRPRLGGTYARTSPVHQAVDELGLRWPSPAADLFFRRAGVGVVAARGPIAAAPPDARCEYADRHTICVLPAGPALPAVGAVDVAGSGPVVGFRVPMPRIQPGPPPVPGGPPPDGEKRPPGGRPGGGPPPGGPGEARGGPPGHAEAQPVTLRCGERTETTPMEAWRVLTLVRDGLTDHADVFFDAPCGGAASADLPGAVALYRTGPGTWPSLPPIVRRHPEIPVAAHRRP